MAAHQRAAARAGNVAGVEIGQPGGAGSLAEQQQAGDGVGWP